MKVYNIDKTEIINDYNLELGYLEKSTIIVHKPEVEEIPLEGHYEVVNEKQIEFVVDFPGVMYQPAETIVEDILVYIPYTPEELELKRCEDLRKLRENECFNYINRGKLWYDNLSEEQIIQLDVWYKAWLDVTETRIIPQKPIWLK